MSSYKTGLDYADVLLPVAPFTESAGTFVNAEGRTQSFHATVNALGEARPGWKVLRVLGSLLGMPGFEFDSIEDVRKACLGDKKVEALLSNKLSFSPESTRVKADGLQRIAEVPIYFTDSIVRRSPPLQKTKDAGVPRVAMNARLMERLGLARNDFVLVRQDGGQAKLRAALDEKVPDECVRIPAGHPLTAGLGAMFGAVTLEKLSVERAA